MSEFHDPELRQQLGRLSGPYPDDNAAFAAWQRRVGQARRRRAVGWTTCAALLLVMGTVSVAALQAPGRQSVVPQKSSETSNRVSVSVATAKIDESSTTVSTATVIIAPDAIDLGTTPNSEASAESSQPEPAGTAAVDSTSKGSTPKGAGSTSPTATSKTTQAAPPQAPQTATQTVNSVGGSITVREDGDRLTITDIHAAAGFKPDHIDHSGHVVGIIFRSSTHSSQISVKVSSNAITPDVVETDSHEESVPVDTSGDSSGGGHGGGGNG
jgi:hypothetical protein